MTNETIDGVSRALLERIRQRLIDKGEISDFGPELFQLLNNTKPASHQKTVPAFKFETLVEHCKRLDKEIAQARAHVNEITLYQQNAVWFWQHDGEDYLQSLTCPIIIQPHHLRELLEGRAQHNPISEQSAPAAVVHPFADKVIRKLQRVQECAEDGQDSDIGRHWLDLLTQLGLLNRLQRSPARWEITQQGEDCLDATAALNGVKP